MRARRFIIGGSAVLLVLAGTAGGAAALHKDVTVRVDGEARQVSGFGTTVADLLALGGIGIGDRDVVSPTLDSTVSNGTTIEVEYAKPVTVIVDGAPVHFYSTATQLEGALTELNLDDLADARLSVSRSAVLPRQGISVEVTTVKNVTVVVAGKRQKVATSAATVADLLDELELTVGERDRLSADKADPVVEGLTLRLDRVSVKTRTLTRTIAHKVITKKDSSAYVGSTTVRTKGKDGVVKQVVEITSVNGEVSKKKTLSRKVVTEPVTEVRVKGTKPKPAAKSSASGVSGVWAQLAKCESGGNPRAVNPLGYYGLYQFTPATWRSVGGSGMPHQASAAEQTKRAKILQKRSGWGQWPACSRKIGVR